MNRGFPFLHNTEAVAKKCSIKKVLLGILQNSQENTCARVSILTKFQAINLQIFIKIETLAQLSSVNFVNFLENTSVAAFNNIMTQLEV